MKPAINDASARQRAVPAAARSRPRRRLGTGPAVRTLSSSNVKLPNWSIGRRRIYEWLGANCIAPDRLWVSVAIC
jgi:hypothetical protein